MKIIHQDKLLQLSCEAAAAPRLRKNLNLHDDYADPCQRLLNALEPGTYIRPHRHLSPAKAECFLAVRGRMTLLVFDDDGAIECVVPFGEGSDIVVIELPPGAWHTLIPVVAGSVFFETKPGPYEPLSDKDFAPWAPAEGSAEASTYLAGLVEELHRRCP
jgi:cupin fold WbuC family metalloprotein